MKPDPNDNLPYDDPLRKRILAAQQNSNPTNPQKPTTPSYAKGVVGGQLKTTGVADTIIPASTVGLEAAREQLENIIGKGLGWVKYDKPDDYELSMYGGMWVEYDGKSGHDLSKAKFIDDILQLMSEAEITARIDENQIRLDRINNWKPQPGQLTTASFGSASGAMETASLKHSLEDRIADLQRLQQGKGGEK
ncbi:MAG: hypothetical protein M3Y81_25460 [Chloroflexota bacterium]|nr:hypothetical protein [Chloroflexota bacterium]